MNQKVNSVKKFITDHKVGIAIVTTAAVTTALLFKADAARRGQWNDFLTEHNLTDAFYNPEA